MYGLFIYLFFFFSKFVILQILVVAAHHVLYFNTASTVLPLYSVSVCYVRVYTVIRNDCRDFNNLPYTVHLR
jgi:hypothetical protein